MRSFSKRSFICLYIRIYILNIDSAMKNRPVKEIRDLIFGNYYKAIGSTKEKSYYSMKRLKKNCCFLQTN